VRLESRFGPEWAQLEYFLAQQGNDPNKQVTYIINIAYKIPQTLQPSRSTADNDLTLSTVSLQGMAPTAVYASMTPTVISYKSIRLEGALRSNFEVKPGAFSL